MAHWVFSAMIMFGLILGPAQAAPVTLTLTPARASHCIESLPRCFGDQVRGAASMSPGPNGITNFMVFDLPDIRGTVTDVRLSIAAGQGVYRSTRGSTIYEVRAIDVPAVLLSTRQSGGGAQTVVNAIQTGRPLGQATIFTPVTNLSEQLMPAVTVDLSADRARVQAALGGSVQYGAALSPPGLVQLLRAVPGTPVSSSTMSLAVVVAPAQVPLHHAGGMVFLSVLAPFGLRRLRHMRAPPE